MKKLTNREIDLIDAMLSDKIKEYKKKKLICRDSFYPKAIKEFSEVRESLAIIRKEQHETVNQ